MSAASPSSIRTIRLRRQLVLALERGIAALDALDAETEDLEDSHDAENDQADWELSEHSDASWSENVDQTELRV